MENSLYVSPSPHIHLLLALIDSILSAKSAPLKNTAANNRYIIFRAFIENTIYNGRKITFFF